MAVLGETDRVLTWTEWMHKNLGDCSFTKTMLRDALNAADDWADLNASAYNLALPVTFRTNATAKQKALLLALVVLKRHDII